MGVEGRVTSATVVHAISPGTMVWQYGYDAMGRPTTVVNPNGFSSYTYYDSLGRPIQTQQPPNTGASTATLTSFTYNAADSLTQVSDPRSLATSYTPNGLRNVTAQSSPDRARANSARPVLSETESRARRIFIRGRWAAAL